MSGVMSESEKRKGGKKKKGDKKRKEEVDPMINVQQSEEDCSAKKSLRPDQELKVSEALLSDFLSSQQIAVVEKLMYGRNLEDDPIIVVRWNFMNILAFFGKLVGLAMIPPALPDMANSIAAAQEGNIDAFIAAVGSCWTAGTGVVPVEGIIFPSTVVDSVRLAQSMAVSALNQWWASVDAAAGPTSFPLVRTFVVKPHTNCGELERSANLPAGLYID